MFYQSSRRVGDIGILYHHWNPQSKTYAGGDQLATALFLGWQLPDAVFVERHWLSEGRHVLVYHFKLTRGGESMTMPVINNPYVSRLVCERNLHTIAVRNHRKAQKRQPVAVKEAVATA
jgi:hypothetical protein